MRVIFRGQMPSIRVKGYFKKGENAMKKLIFLFLILTTLLLAVACGNESATTVPETSIWDSPATWVPESSVITSTAVEITLVPQTTVITEPKLVLVHPESYEAISVVELSCKSGTLYNYSDKYDAKDTLEDCKSVSGNDMPLALRESGLDENSSKAEFMAHAKKILLAYVGDAYDIDSLLIERQGAAVANSWEFVFHCGALSAPRAKVTIRSDGRVMALDIYKELHLDYFGKIDLNSTALTDAVNALQHDNQTKKTTYLKMGQTHLYLVVDIDHERHTTDEEGDSIPVEHLNNIYYILLAEFVPAVE